MFAIVCLPGVARARSQGVKFARTPAVVQTKNSQTMSLLSANLNINPIPTRSAHLATIDDNALSADSDQGVGFVDAGKSGTGQISVYVVHKGDTLPMVAKMFEVSANTIKWANDLKGNTISEGQELVILPISGVKHTVKKGDTIKSIATKYKADLDEIVDFNDVSVDSALAVGTVVIVPDGEVVTVTTPTITKAKGVINKLTGIKSYAGYYMRPLNGGTKTQGIHGHNGVDLANSVGTPIMASAAGTVLISKSSGFNGGYGLYVVVSHPNGTQTVYGHLNSVNVSVGQSVSQGQVIGGLGNSGKSTGAHLHFEIRGATNPF